MDGGRGAKTGENGEKRGWVCAGDYTVGKGRKIPCFVKSTE